MKKRIAFWLAAMLMFVMIFSAFSENANLTEKERIEKLRDIVQEFIDEKGYNFSYDEKNEWFTGEFKLGSVLEKCEVIIFLFSDSVMAAARPDIVVPEENRISVAILQTMLNNWLLYSHLNMDINGGKIESFSSHIVKNVFPSAAEIEKLISEAVASLENCGDYINSVAFGADPYETYMSFVKAQSGEP